MTQILAAMKPVDYRTKILPLAGLPDWRSARRANGKTVVVTNGCFDLLHVGHLTYLEAARNLGDELLVGVNSDQSVRALKGADRPLNAETDRAALLAGLESVAAVVIFPERTATRFLALAQPDIYVKGGDYTLDTLHPEERRAVERAGGKIILQGLVPGRSTTALLTKMTGLREAA